MSPPRKEAVAPVSKKGKQMNNTHATPEEAAQQLEDACHEMYLTSPNRPVLEAIIDRFGTEATASDLIDFGQSLIDKQ